MENVELRKQKSQVRLILIQTLYQKNQIVYEIGKICIVKYHLCHSREFDDTSTCWHGGGIYEDCNNRLWTRNLILRHRGGNCKWWHFYPDETYDKLESKFKEIVRGNQETGLMNNFISMARKMELNTFGKVFGP